ncbi:phylloplanin-like [Hordeum vulgare]|uniref:Uncharacterized protein n=1 Tax=Hordeum vulgare subsp. vulgare TaxID=112509 RepID=A0A8I7BGC0_HORVV|nr:phylloplanin-like [Hordeum vulgare subsp. vulgare]KAE8820638.1 phylloplanin-like [Hordeum vulgare]
MATKTLLLAGLLALAVSLAPHGAEAGGQPPLMIVSGVVPCSAGNSINAAAVPPFPNAAVQMVCARSVMASATADRTGAYTMNMGAATSSLLAPLLGNHCKVVVVTPLAACNASLASVTGTLAAPVQLLGIDSGTGGLGGLGGLIGGLVGGILNIIPLPFSVV